MRFPLGLQRDRWFITLLACVAAVRLAMLFISQSAIHGDEAIVGIMAKHIAELGARPVYCYAANYAGGSAVTAYLTTILFAVFGMTEKVLKLAPIGYSLIALTFVYLLVRAHRGVFAGFICALFYATSVMLLKWNFDARGCYIECQVLTPLAFWLLTRRCLRTEGGRFVHHLALGFVCGFGFYILEVFGPVVLTTLMCFFIRDKLFFARKNFIGWIVGALIGLSPMLYYNFTHEWANYQHIAEYEKIPFIRHMAGMPATLVKTFTTYLPGSITYKNPYGMQDPAPTSAWVEYGVLLISLGALAVWRRKEMFAFAKASAGRQTSPGRTFAIEPVLFAFIAVYLVLYSSHKLAGSNARYFLFLEPALSILSGLAFAEAFERLRNKRSLLIGGAFAALFALTMANRAAQYGTLAGDRQIYGIHRVCSPDAAWAIIDLLDEKGYEHAVVEDYDLRWRIVFLTNERIIASNFTDSRMFSRYPRYERTVRHTGRYAGVLLKGGVIERQFIPHLSENQIPYERYECGDHAIYIGIPPIL